VLNHFIRHQQHEERSLEAGGQLFAELSEREVVITEATGPRIADWRSRYLYLPSRQEEQREINQMHRKLLHFVGDWHTHPEPFPSPSPSDVRTINEAVLKSQHHLNGFVMVIVGSSPFPDGLHVSLNTATSHLRLVPVI
jgi:integrative and conjugative element protein (TIGR02256 family)